MPKTAKRKTTKKNSRKNKTRKNLKKGGVMPPGWREAFDQASGQKYYYNEKTGVTQWQKPTIMGQISKSIFGTKVQSESMQQNGTQQINKPSWGIIRSKGEWQKVVDSYLPYILDVNKNVILLSIPSDLNVKSRRVSEKIAAAQNDYVMLNELPNTYDRLKNFSNNERFFKHLSDKNKIKIKEIVNTLEPYRSEEHTSELQSH